MSSTSEARHVGWAGRPREIVLRASYGAARRRPPGARSSNAGSMGEHLNMSLVSPGRPHSLVARFQGERDDAELLQRVQQRGQHGHDKDSQRHGERVRV